jgi:hypothetical protein
MSRVELSFVSKVAFKPVAPCCCAGWYNATSLSKADLLPIECYGHKSGRPEVMHGMDVRRVVVATNCDGRNGQKYPCNVCLVRGNRNA